MKFLRRRRRNLPTLLERLVETGAPVVVVSVQPRKRVAHLVIWPQMNQIAEVPLDDLSLQLDVISEFGLGISRTARVTVTGELITETSVLLPESDS